jgi:hypothetical protein
MSRLASSCAFQTAEHKRADPSREWMIDVRTVSHKLNSYQELAIWRTFAIGVGFANRIRSTQSEKMKGDQLLVSAKLELWPGSVLPAVLQIDRHGIVRKATIDVGYSTITVTTTGLRQHSKAFRGATKGTFARTNKHQPKVTAPAFEIEIKLMKFGISDERFNELADLSPPAGERVSDVTPARLK